MKVMRRGGVLNSFENRVGEMIPHGDGKREPVDGAGGKKDIFFFQKAKIGHPKE